ncbi:MAG: putative CRISPR-associated protein [Spirochaetes bacterium]|nr:putative CRISPR-associated protein [Spirochaetota bacterium]
MPNVILTTCGTSLLTNNCNNEEERKLISTYANIKLEDFPNEDWEKLQTIIDDVKNKVKGANLQEITKMSAELNALVKFYEYQPFPSADRHFLLSTDTWLGEEAAEIVEQFLSRNGCGHVERIRQPNLQTADIQSFQFALSEIAEWIGRKLPGYKRSHRIIFNLTGGFKSVNAFLQTLAMFYADEIIYIFESEKELLRIPRLPVKMDATETVRRHFATLRRLSLKLDVNEDDIEEIPETLVLRLENEVRLSPFGRLIWQQEKENLYAEQLHPSPTNKITFSQRFIRDVENLPPDRKKSVNERIDDLVNCVHSRENPARLDFKKLHGNPKYQSTYECDAWSDRDARRIFMHYEGDILVLDSLDKGLH